MGRKRIKPDVEQEVLLKQSQQRFDFKDDDGLYPFSNLIRWRPQNGKAKGTVVSLTLDADTATEKELSTKGENVSRFFYSEFREEYPWAARALARGLKTMCLNTRVSHSKGSYCRHSVGQFFQYCRKEKIRLESFEDLNFQLLCRWRSDLRSVEMQSRYKAGVYRRFCQLLELLMGTSEFPVKFAVPIYRSDAPDQLLPYSDAVMYQLIAAAITDVESVMTASARFEELVSRPEIPSGQHPVESKKEYDWKEIVAQYMQSGCDIRSAVNSGVFPNSGARAELSRKTSYIFVRSPKVLKGFVDEIGLVATLNDQGSGGALRRLDEKRVPSRDSLFPFFLFFIICSGANKETAYSWRNKYEVGGTLVSPLDCKDPFDPMKCRLRGVKFRGKGKLHAGVEDTWIDIADEGMYPILKFLLWYVEPLSELVDEKSKYNLWLYNDWKNRGVHDYYEHDVFSSAASAFLSRHEIWDMQFDAEGAFGKTRVTTLDSRRFRKVYTAKELLKAINESRNFQELASQLQGALHHEKFDTTLASYMSLGKSKDIIDIGIFTLQTDFVEQARKFRGVRVDLPQSAGRPGIYAVCADPAHPDYEGASGVESSECGEYDMCLGCSQSRVFSLHLPRIATRILQYEDFRKSMPRESWEVAFGRKMARAHDLLNDWSDQDEVAEAWKKARAGTIFLPKIIVRG